MVREGGGLRPIHFCAESWSDAYSQKARMNAKELYVIGKVISVPTNDAEESLKLVREILRRIGNVLWVGSVHLTITLKSSLSGIDLRVAGSDYVREGEVAIYYDSRGVVVVYDPFLKEIGEVLEGVCYGNVEGT